MFKCLPNMHYLSKNKYLQAKWRDLLIKRLCFFTSKRTFVKITKWKFLHEAGMGADRTDLCFVEYLLWVYFSSGMLSIRRHYLNSSVSIYSTICIVIMNYILHNFNYGATSHANISVSFHLHLLEKKDLSWYITNIVMWVIRIYYFLCVSYEPGNILDIFKYIDQFNIHSLWVFISPFFRYANRLRKI